MRLSVAIGLSFGLFGAIAAANAAGCPGNPGALGTSRVLKIDPRQHPQLGTMQYHDTLPLADKEVVLTFDDGPMPPYTNRILEVLAHECVKVNYFIIGRMARGYPDLLRRIHAEGHVIGTHSENHPLAFDKMPARAVQAEIDQGIASVGQALGNRDAVAPFFRIPGLLRAEGVEGYTRSRGLTVWSADVAADDWKHITASEVVNRSIARLESRGKGILLLHDIQPATALALPHLLRELKRRGYRIVQVAPQVTPQVAPPAPAAAAAVASAAKPPAPPAVKPAPAIAAAPAVTPPTPATARAEPPVGTMTAQRAAPEVRAPAPAAPTPAARAPEAAAQARQPDPIPPAAAPAATQAETASAADNAEPPRPRAHPVQILDAARVAAPRGATAMQTQEGQTTRPLTSGFKPSHSDPQPEKVTEMPPEPRRIDIWGSRADVMPAPAAPQRPFDVTQALPR